MRDEFIIDKRKLVDALINNTPIAYIIMDDLNRIHFVNESFLKLRGLEWDKTVGELCYNISNGGKHCKYCSISRAMETGCKTMLQRKDILPNGSIRYIDDYAIPLYRDKQTELVVDLEEMEHSMDIDEMIDIIFENTPCGYVLIDNHNVVKFANDYVLSLFGYHHEEFVGSCCDLFCQNEKDLVRRDCIRMQRNVPSGVRIFDSYQCELSDDSNTYKMYVILDRTKEVTIRSKLQQSYWHLLKILQDLSDNEWGSADMAAKKKLEEINDKAKLLAAQYGL